MRFGQLAHAARRSSACVSRVALITCIVGLAACGSRSELRQQLDGSEPEPKSVELCNNQDDDADTQVDESFRDEQGRYLSDEHCGACGNACGAEGPDVLESECRLVAETPTCAATLCARGLAPTRAGGCAERDMFLCLSCAQDSDCGPLSAAHCVDVGSEARCVVDCEVGCAPGYACNEQDLCVPEGGSCRCDEGQTFDIACAAEVPDRKPSDPVCLGRARCENGTLSACSTSAEICDGIDNDCNGKIDDGFRDALGSYSLDPANCGQCGASCLEDTQTELTLACGGDPFAPRCVLQCPDARNGIQAGDKLDGDQDIASGCECSVTSLDDVAGPLLASGALLDVNCDGADGVVVESIYVAPDGNDMWAGSPTRPLRTLSAAMDRARESLSTKLPRPHVFVASGSYTETLALVDGILLHGGYRRDFRALDPSAFEVELRAPLESQAPGGAALIATDVGKTTTRVEWITVRGRDATSDQTPTFAAYFVRAGRALTLRDVGLYAGVPGRGIAGKDGIAGATASTAASDGGRPRGAVENGRRECLPNNANRVAGGEGAPVMCGSSNVSGGRGGTARCPTSADFQASGAPGNPTTTGGAGGAGGQDAAGPISNGPGCPDAVCCGLADFSVSGSFQGPRGGASGTDGSAGSAGGGCSDALGSFLGTQWVTAQGKAGSAGGPGAGGGGGGAGGGVAMQYIENACEFADGLGGGGGGGGAGGCGGVGGSGGLSAAPSIALFVVETGAFSMQGVTFAPASGDRGGLGGAGGDGGRGSAGGFGGALLPSEKTTPTLAGTFSGARGGRGGDGGAGGGGGGGCGGSSVGVWVAGKAPANLNAWRNDNVFALGSGGAGGEGGGGAKVGSAGKIGEAVDVVVR